MAIIPDFLRPLVRPFADAFTRPTFKRFTLLMAGAVLTHGRRTISNLLRTVRGFNVVHAAGMGMDWTAVSDVSADVLSAFVARLASGG